MNQSNTSGEASAMMPRYIGCKQVYALRIRSIEPMDGGRARLTFYEAFAPITVEPGWVEKRGASAGGFFIQYQDGYTSFNPAASFEKDYIPAESWGVRFKQEPKYRVNMQGRLVNRETGTPIPDEEPVVTFRAKDMLLPAVLNYYAQLLPPGEHRDSIEAQCRAVEAFQQDHRAIVRIPD
jgi:hypothetical protein